jgi:alkylresorcinol/alkylpyrone synthase
MLTSTGFRHVASSALPVSVLRNLRASVADFLGRHGLRLEQLGFVVVNPRNERLLAVMAHLLSVPEPLLAPARRVWESRGNTLSVGPLYLLQVLQRTAPPRDGDLGVVVVLGPGVSCDLMLLRWHGEVACGSLQA